MKKLYALFAAVLMAGSMMATNIATLKASYEANTLNDNDSVIVEGYVANMFLKPTNFAKYGSVCVWLTDTLGGEAHEFELYNCYGLNGDTLRYFGPNYTTTGTANINVDTVSCDGTLLVKGAKVSAAGKFKYYSGTLELNTGCYLVSVDNNPQPEPVLVESVTATYTDASSDYPNYNDPDWGMVEGAQFTVERYSNDSIVIRNWMNQNVDLCMSYDEGGYIKAVNNPGGTPSYWAYADATYYAYVACQAYSSTSSWYSPATNQIFLLISWGETWDNYNLAWNTASSIKSTVIGEKAAKVIENGQVVIIRDGVRYNALGSVVK